MKLIRTREQAVRYLATSLIMRRLYESSDKMAMFKWCWPRCDMLSYLTGEKPYVLYKDVLAFLDKEIEKELV